ncbi:alpha/beta fold hydrolase [Flavisphingomonas formosensis]|uniref:alpha/beta fold hydrolase n=1 Tax=Flavisphingomonas formosensis TaxID=861534 RepID=UPI0012FA90F6|nr:alpha/beta hydrolase [Sphingomonas formosensis]
MRLWRRTGMIGLCLQMGLLLMGVCGSAAAIASSSPEPVAADVRDVAVDGRTLRFEIRRGPPDGPVVLLEAGATLDLREWDPVIHALGGRAAATLIAYDRAGMGHSQPLSTSYDIYEEVARLHRALYRLGLSKRLILVGHSYGGFLTQLYANLFPAEVRALIYVDANTVEGLGGLEAAEAFRTSILDAAKAGKTQFNDLRLADGYVATMRTMMRNPVPCGLPVTVITQGAADAAITDAKLLRWREGHRGLARRSGATLLFAAHSGHMIPRDQPEIVADAILAAIARETAKRPLLSFPPPEADCTAKAAADR